MQQKGNKFATELQGGYKLTNDGQYKTDKNGYCLELTDTEKAFRSGYLQARKDSAKAYKATKKKKKDKK